MTLISGATDFSFTPTAVSADFSFEHPATAMAKQQHRTSNRFMLLLLKP